MFAHLAEPHSLEEPHSAGDKEKGGIAGAAKFPPENHTAGSAAVVAAVLASAIEIEDGKKCSRCGARKMSIPPCDVR